MGVAVEAHTDFGLIVLPPERWGELPSFTSTDEPRPLPHETVMLAAEESGRLVGSFSLQRVICGSHFWVDKEWRGRGVARSLAVEAFNLAQLARMQAVMATTNRHVELLAHSMGLVPVKGTLWRCE